MVQQMTDLERTKILQNGGKKVQPTFSKEEMTRRNTTFTPIYGEIRNRCSCVHFLP